MKLRLQALTQLSISDSAPKMGRPPLNVKPTVVRLSQEVIDRIDAVAGPNQRAAFIREAVDRELERRAAEEDDG